MACSLAPVFHFRNCILRRGVIQSIQKPLLISKKYKWSNTQNDDIRSHDVGKPTAEDIWMDLPIHLRKWKDELTSHPFSLFVPISPDNNPSVEDGETNVIWNFQGNDSLDDWILSTDKGENMGFSEAELALTKGNYGVLRGTLSTKIQNRAIQDRAGYVSLISKRRWKSFGRKDPYDWSGYTHLVIRCRGDGRAYTIGLGLEESLDLHRSDLYAFFLFTRGGPYWQTTKIPFSKFFLTHKGKLQDRQQPIDLSRVATCSIALGDDCDGPFSLELDYIGVHCDDNHTERTAYEMYRTSIDDHSI